MRLIEADMPKYRFKWPVLFEKFLASGNPCMEIVEYSTNFKSVQTANATISAAIFKSGYDKKIRIVKDKDRLFLIRKEAV